MNLRPYQQVGREMMAARRRLYNADGMRLGKTRQAIAAAYDCGFDRVQVIGPASARYVWPAERAELLGVFGPEFRFTSYSMAIRPGEIEKIAQWKPQALILDEAHYLKSMDAQVTQKVLGSRNNPGILRDLEAIWPLSGTPMPNHPGELYTVLKRVWPERLRAIGITSYLQWLNRFCAWEQTRYGIKVKWSRNDAELNELLFGGAEPIMMRRTMDQVAPDLEPIEWSTEVIDTGLQEIGEPEYSERHFAEVAHAVGVSKAFEASAWIAERILDGAVNKCVVFAYHLEVIRQLSSTFNVHGIRHVTVTGSTSPTSKEDFRRDFQDPDGDVRIYLAQIKANKEAIDLSAADHAFFVETLWSPGDNHQAAERLRLPDKPRPCFATVFVARGTIDEPHAKVLLRKERTQNAVGLRHG